MEVSSLACDRRPRAISTLRATDQMATAMPHRDEKPSHFGLTLLSGAGRPIPHHS
jgi:hypothetical protein